MKKLKLFFAVTVAMISITDCKAKPENVEVQSWTKFKKSMKKSVQPGKGIQNAANTVAKSMGVNPGEVGYPCAKHSSCKTGNCASGLCQKKFDVGGPCQKGVQCKSGVCIEGLCRVKMSNGKKCNKDNHCQSGKCKKKKCK